MNKKIVFTVFLLTVTASVYGQSFLNWQLRDRYFSLYTGTGWTGYIGELTNGKPISNGISHFNIGVEARLYSKIGARAQFATYRIEGTDSNAPDSSFNRQRNLSFSSHNYEWSFQAVYYFLKYRKKYHRRRTYEPYAAIGIGQTFFSPRARYNGTWYNLRDLQLEGSEYKKSAWVLPIGVGVKAAFNEFINLGLDLGYRFAFTSHLDDVSGNFTGPYESGTSEAFLANRKDQVPIRNQSAYERLVPGSPRGKGTNDAYFMVNFNLEVYIPGDIFKSKKGTGKKEPILSKPSAYD